MATFVDDHPTRPVTELSRSRLEVLTGFRFLRAGRPMSFPHGVERVVAFLGITRVPTSRTRLAGLLWPNVSEQRASGDLRSALWRLRRITGVIREENRSLSLVPDVDVDVLEMTQLARSLVEGAAATSLSRVPELVGAGSILPGWDEEWLVVERERYRILRLRALERSAEAFLDAGEHPAALDASLASIDTDPYRESAHRLVVRTHIAEGNYAEAIRAYESYRTRVGDELGISPSAWMEDLVAPLRKPWRAPHQGMTRR